MKNFRRRSLLAAVSPLVLALWVTGCVATQQPDVQLPDADAADQTQAEAEAAGGPGESFDTVMRYGQHAENGGNYLMASKLYHKAHEMRPEANSPLVKLIQSYRRLERPATASTYFDRALRLDPRNIDLLIEHGLLLVELQRPQAARIRFIQALDLEESPRLYNMIAVTHDMEGNRLAAQPNYRAALELDPTNLTAKSNLGLSLALSGEFETSIALLEDVLSDPSARPRHIQMLATAHALAGNLERAQEVGGEDFGPDRIRATLENVAGVSGRY